MIRNLNELTNAIDRHLVAARIIAWSIIIAIVVGAAALFFYGDGHDDRCVYGTESACDVDSRPY